MYNFCTKILYFLMKLTIFAFNYTYTSTTVMTRFRTAIELPVGKYKISHKNNMLLAGSCFAGNIGKMLADRKFDISVNPFGVLYNPLSIATMFARIIDGKPFTKDSPELFEHNGKWHSILHHGDFSRNTQDELLDTINDNIAESHRKAKECDTVIVTFGTAYAYIRKSDGIVAGNCHKLPAETFTRRLLSIEEIVGTTAEIVEQFRNINPNIKFIFTVSPIRHLRDGAHDNQKSKATLLLAIDKLTTLFPDNTLYFPAYEIVLDELRDYRFYAEDMVHPSAVAVEYIWECFGKCYFDKETDRLNEEIEAIIRAMEHRPFDMASDGYKKFLKNLLGKIEAIEDKYSYIDFENEKTRCNTLLNI